MRPRIKIILGVAGALLVAAHVVLWVVMSNMGPKILEESLSRHLGCTVTTDRVKVSLLSQGVKIINLRLSDPSDPGAEPFFTAKKVLLRVNLFALVARRITIRNMIFLSPSLSVTRNAEGKWILPFRPRNRSASPAPAQKETPSGTGPDAPSVTRPDGRKPFFELKFYKLDVKKGEVLFADETFSPPFWVRIKNIAAKGQFATKTLLRFHMNGQVECRESANFEVQGEAEILGGKLNGNIAAQLDNLDVTLLAPYYQKHSPAVISEGKISLRSKFLCNEDVLKDSVQTITLRGLKINSWKEDFLNGRMFGISNKEIARYVDDNSGEMSVDFSISGPLRDLKAMPAQDTLRLLGMSALDQWLRKSGSQ